MKNLVFKMVLATSFVALGTAADAGFEWRAPVEPEPRIQVKAAPVPAVEEVMEPNIKWEESQKDDMDLPPPVSDTVPMTPTKADMYIETIQKDNRDEVEMAAMDSAPIMPQDGEYYGFGKDIALPLALGQIVPDGMTTVFARSVNLGQRISWQGNGSWQDTLYQAMSEIGLSYTVEGNTVYVAPDYEIRARAATNAKVASVSKPMKDDTSHGAIELSNAPDAMLPESVMGDMVESTAPVTATKVDASAMTKVPMEKVSRSNWTAMSGMTLRETLEQWTAESESDLYWLIDYDYRLKKDVSFDGNFETAVRSLLDQFNEVEPRPYGQLYRSSNNSHVLTIRAYGVE